MVQKVLSAQTAVAVAKEKGVEAAAQAVETLKGNVEGLQAFKSRMVDGLRDQDDYVSLGTGGNDFEIWGLQNEVAELKEEIAELRGKL